MDNKKTLKVSISDIRPNMILAQDVVNANGIIILPKNIMLNNVNFTKLRSNKISYITVYENSIDTSLEHFVEEVHTIEEQMKPVTERKEFKIFDKEYNKKVDDVKKCLLAIGNGENVDIEQTYAITKDIIDKISCKSDVMSYLGYLKETDDYTYSHSINVSLLCNLFARWIGMDEEETKMLTVSGLFHDLGKTKIDKAILNKKEKLTPEEFKEIKNHPMYGYTMVKDMDLPKNIKKAILMHHEKINGSGYPFGSKGDEINKYAKIVAICDIYDAMTSTRSYREKICPFEVINNFEQNSLDLLDTEYLLAFLENIAYTYVGSWVQLTNGQIAEILFINKSQMSRPIVKCNEKFIDLATEKNINIKNII